MPNIEKFFSDYTRDICTCHSCHTSLGYNPLEVNVYSGGPFYCGKCGADVTEDIYGKPKEKTN